MRARDRVELFPLDLEAAVLIRNGVIALSKVESQAGIDVHRGVRADGPLFCPWNSQQLCGLPGRGDAVPAENGQVVEADGHGNEWGGLKSEPQHIAPGKVPRCKTELHTDNSSLKCA
jgi:hypothetical protein